jgi:CHAD domain-containing protein
MTSSTEDQDREEPYSDGDLSPGKIAANALLRQLDWLRLSSTLLNSPLDPRIVHDMRVAARRCRVSLREFGYLIGQERAHALRTELAWVSVLLGDTRDWDIVIGRSRKWVEKKGASAPPALARALDVLDAARSRSVTGLVDGLGSNRYTQLIHDLGEVVSELQGSMSDNASNDDVLGTAAKRIRRVAKQLGDRLRGQPAKLIAADLHRVRILLRRLRYVLELYLMLLPEETVDLLGKLVIAQENLGEAQDADTSERLLGSLRASSGPEGSADPELDLAFGLLIKRESRRARRARAQLEQTWTKLPKTLKRVRRLTDPSASD